MKKLLKVERWLLENAGNYNSYRCPTHGVFQQAKGHLPQGCCTFKKCTAPITTITDPLTYAKTH